MQLLFEFAPIILFFVAFKFWGIYAATSVAIATTVIQVLVLRLLKRKVSPMLWVSLVIIVLMGGATIFLHNESFIKAKPTVIYWLFGLAILIGEVFYRKNIFKSLSQSGLDLADSAWNFLNRSWMFFFFVAGALNIYVAYNFKTETWVNFKLFGVIGGMLVLAVIQGVYITKNTLSDEDKE